MKLRGIDFGNVFGASGVQGLFGEGYWFHHLGSIVGLDLSKITFVSKTSTLFPQKGNMPLNSDFTPKEYFPDCVKVKFLKGLMLNAVGLSNPGIETLLKTGQWQKRKSPFLISVMSLAQNKEARLVEIKKIRDILFQYKEEFLSSFGLQVNLSCPNTGHDPKELIGESSEVLDILSALNVPLIPKYSIASAPISAVMELEQHPSCDAICVSNTIPFGWKELDWNKIWGATTSPLQHLGGGGLSGPPLRPLVCNWIKELRNKGFTKPIDGGGGIMTQKDVWHYHQAGASSIYIGTIASLRPWRVSGVIQYANSLDWK